MQKKLPSDIYCLVINYHCGPCREEYICHEINKQVIKEEMIRINYVISEKRHRNRLVKEVNCVSYGIYQARTE
jgi:hypothetical protein